MMDSEKLSPKDITEQKNCDTTPNKSNVSHDIKYEELITESIKDTDSLYEEEDIDIQVVNELATMEDDTTLPCFTLRVFVTGVVSIQISIDNISVIN